jgi:hypothetical protein
MVGIGEINLFFYEGLVKDRNDNIYRRTTGRLRVFMV